MVHEEEDGLFPVPKMLAYESLNPELQYSYRAHLIGLSAYRNVGLWRKDSGDDKNNNQPLNVPSLAFLIRCPWC